MKRVILLKKLSEAGCILKRHGANHDIYINPANGRIAPIPRHTEIKNSLCDLILKQLGVVET